MLKLYTKIQAWKASDEGATAVEYGVMVALIAAAIIAMVLLLGGALNDLFEVVKDKIVANTPA